jgi:hypothetical protein
MHPNPDEADAVQETLNYYTKEYNRLNKNPQTSAKDIESIRINFLDRLCANIGRFFSEYDLLFRLGRGVAYHAPEQLDAAKALNEQFKTLAQARPGHFQSQASTQQSATPARVVDFATMVRQRNQQYDDRQANQPTTAFGYPPPPTDLAERLPVLNAAIGGRWQANKALASIKSGVEAGQSHSSVGSQAAAMQVAALGYQAGLSSQAHAVPPQSSSYQPPPGLHSTAPGSQYPNWATTASNYASQIQQRSGPPYSQEIYAPVPVRGWEQLQTITSAGEQNDETSEKISYLSKAKSALNELVKSIKEGNDAKVAAIWSKIVKPDKDLRFSVDHVKEVIEAALSRVGPLRSSATTEQQLESLRGIEDGLTSSYHTIQNVIDQQSQFRSAAQHLEELKTSARRAPGQPGYSYGV